MTRQYIISSETLEKVKALAEEDTRDITSTLQILSYPIRLQITGDIILLRNARHL